MVITFLPYKDFEQSLRSLDDRRLGKQRIEALQMYKALRNPDAKGWKNHPAALMWKGHEDHLAMYYNKSLDVWKSRGKNNNMEYIEVANTAQEEPWWLGWSALHRSHMAALLRKEPQHYEKEFDALVGPYRHYGYIWPTHVEQRIDIMAEDADGLFVHLTDKINERQLLPLCKKDGCRNRVRKYVREDGTVVFEWCGVHVKKYLSKNPK
jgi:hypothetical protein